MARPKPDRLRARFLPIAALALILAAGTWAYSTSFRGVFVWDDDRAIVENEALRALWPPKWFSLPPDLTLSGRPVASLTFALNHALAPDSVADVMKPAEPGAPPDAVQRFYRNLRGYHAFNLAIHLLAGLTLFGIVRRTLVSEPLFPRFGNAAGVLALVAALAWLLHPLNTQAVTYIVQRVESLMGLFYLLTLYCAIRAGEGGPRAKWWAGGSIVSCALGMGTKEVMVSAPIVVWLWDEVFRPGSRIRRWPLYAGLAATWAILAWLVALEPRPGSVGPGLGWSSWEYLRTQAAVVAHYLRLAVVPGPLVFDYDWPKQPSLGAVAAQAALLAALAALTAVALWRKHPAGFAGACFFVILAPTSSVVPIPTEVAAEHRMYLPLAAVVASVVAGAFSAGRALLSYRPALGPLLRAAGVVGALAVIVLLGSLTHDRNRVYWSKEALFFDTVSKRPENARVRVAYGLELLTATRFAEAEEHLKVAIGLDAGPRTKAHAHMYLGSAIAAQGRPQEGTPHLVRALELDPTLSDAAALLGEATSSLGRTEEAAKYFTAAVDATPDNPVLLRRVAWYLATVTDDKVRDGARAVEYAERACRLTEGRDPMSLESLAAAYAEQGSFEAAARVLRQAIDVARARGEAAFVRVLEEELAVVSAGQRLRVAPR